MMMDNRWQVPLPGQQGREVKFEVKYRRPGEVGTWHTMRHYQTGPYWLNGTEAKMEARDLAGRGFEVEVWHIEMQRTKVMFDV